MSINSVILYFIRSGMGKVKRLTLICEYEDGSLKMPNQMATSEIRKQFHARFVKVPIISGAFRRGKLSEF